MSPALVLAAILLALAWASFTTWRQVRARRSLIERTPISPAAEVREGHVEIKGTIVPVRSVNSPITGKPAVYLKHELQEERWKNKIDAFVTVKTIEKRMSFRVDDGTGAVKVRPEKAELLYATDTVTAAIDVADASPEIRELLEEAGLEESDFHGKRLRVIETRLEPGDEVWVCGAARKTRDGWVVDQAESRELPFLISDKREEAVLAHLASAERASGFGAAAAGIAAAVMLVVAFG